MRSSASSSSFTLELDHLDYSSSSRMESGKLLGDEENEWNTSDLYEDRQNDKDETRSAQDEPSPRRPSLRLMVVHFLHGMLLLISIFTLLVSFWRWEHKVEVDTNNVSQVTSIISIVVQVFFTACILLLYLLSSAVAIDAAIRHPRSIIDLDFRLQAWYGGMGPAIANGIFRMYRFRQVSRSVLFGVPLYFIIGEVLKVTSSSVLGINIYTTTTPVAGSAQSHIVWFEYPNLNHTDHDLYDCSAIDNLNTDFYKVQDLWKVSKQILSLNNTGNDTTHPGLIGNTIYDIPDSSPPFDVGSHLNGTRMNVHCSHVKPDDTTFELRYDSDDISDQFAGYYVRWTADNPAYPYAEMHNRPPYGTLNSSYVNISTLSPIIFDSEFDQGVYILMQKWTYDEWWPDDTGFKAISNQVLFVVAAPDITLLLHDSSGSVASVNLTTLDSTDACFNVCGDNNLDKNSADCVDYMRQHTDCVANSETWHFQAVGCTLQTAQSTLAVTQSGLLAPESYSRTQPSKAHEWDDFSPVNPHDGYDFLANEFLEMFVLAPCSVDSGNNTEYQDLGVMSGVIINILLDNQDLNHFENTLANMTASYLWNVWQQCDSPFKYGWSYQQCSPRSDDFAASLATTAAYDRLETKARLQIVQWKAAVTVLCGLVLFFLAFYLLGTSTDSRVGVPLREARFMETSRLLKDSSIPEVVSTAAPGFENKSIRYIRNGAEERKACLDIYK
ncbi:hypothetical protein BDZ89DRAFT_1134663 [Hymenopellis radicata]|nr:hypothetical protein BDZ89DRAFT_1134663 [Hymenopellis radicata]